MFCDANFVNLRAPQVCRTKKVLQCKLLILLKITFSSISLPSNRVRLILVIIKSSKFAVSFRVNSRPESAFLFLRWFILARICIQVTSLHRGEGFESISNFSNSNRFHGALRIFSPKICKQWLRVKRRKAKAKAEANNSKAKWISIKTQASTNKNLENRFSK